MGRRASGPAAEEALSAPNPFRFTTLAHAGRDVLGPVSVAVVDALLARLARDDRVERVLDVGCGKGVTLVRALEHLGGSGIGVEPNPAFASDARERVARRLPPGRAVVLEAPLADAPLPAHAFGLGICTGALHAFGDWRETLQGMTRLVAADGWALLGPGYWKRVPHPDYLAAFGGSEDEQHPLPTTLSLAEDAGWQVVACHESSLAEWDEYEHGYAARVREWCDANPRDPDASAFRERVETWAAAYARWGRDTMGYALLLLRRPV